MKATEATIISCDHGLQCHCSHMILYLRLEAVINCWGQRPQYSWSHRLLLRNMWGKHDIWKSSKRVWRTAMNTLLVEFYANKKGEYKGICRLKAAQVHVYGPPLPRIYICAGLFIIPLFVGLFFFARSAFVTVFKLALRQEANMI